MGKIDKKMPKNHENRLKILIFSVEMCVLMVEIVIASHIKITQEILNTGKAN